MFPRALPQPSVILTVTLPRPLGVVLEWDERLKRAIVIDTVSAGTVCLLRCAALQRALVWSCVLPSHAKLHQSLRHHVDSLAFAHTKELSATAAMLSVHLLQTDASALPAQSLSPGMQQVPGTAADQQRRRAALLPLLLPSPGGASTQAVQGASVQPGDVLRAVTCTNFV